LKHLTFVICFPYIEARNMTDALELIGQIYDAAFDPALWPDVLVHLADAVGGA
jgi:hypothetical protein